MPGAALPDLLSLCPVPKIEIPTPTPGVGDPSLQDATSPQGEGHTSAGPEGRRSGLRVGSRVLALAGGVVGGLAGVRWYPGGVKGADEVSGDGADTQIAKFNAQQNTARAVALGGLGALSVGVGLSFYLGGAP